MYYFSAKYSCPLASLLMVHHVCSYFSGADIKSLIDKMHVHENTITKILQYPKLNDSVQLIESLEQFNSDFVQLVSAIKEPNSTFDDIRLFHSVGPKFLNIKPDTDYLKTSLNWSEHLIEEVYYALGVSDVLWFELKQLDPRGEHYPIVDNVTKEELTFLNQMDKENRLNELIEFTKLDDFQRTDVPPNKNLK